MADRSAVAKNHRRHEISAVGLASKFWFPGVSNNGGPGWTWTTELALIRVAWLGFTTTCNNAGTAKLRGSYIRRRLLWVGLWVGRSPRNAKRLHIHLPDPISG